jgi:hypothetical protein
MTVLDDWATWVQSQITAAEQWAQANPVISGLIVVVVSGIVIVAAGKAADAVLGH